MMLVQNDVSRSVEAVALGSAWHLVNAIVALRMYPRVAGVSYEGIYVRETVLMESAQHITHVNVIQDIELKVNTNVYLNV